MSRDQGVLILETDYRKFTLLSFFLFSVLAGYVFYLAATTIADIMKIGGSNVLWGYSWAVVGGAGSTLFGLILMISLCVSSKATGFVDEVFGEVFKVTWPSLKETSASTLVVSVMVLVAAFVLAVMDYFWGSFFNLILNKL